jgi:peptidyl-prolyl cis-trans isomerase SurA
VLTQTRFILIAALFAAAIGSAVAQETGIVAVVNEDVITTADVGSRITLLLRSSGIPDNDDNRQRMAPRVLRTLIDEKLQLQEAKRLNVTASKDDVDQALTRLEQQNNLPKGGLDKYLERLSIPRSALIEQITASVTWNKLVQSRLSQDVSISDQEVAEAMKRVKEASNVPLNQVSEIFLAVDNPSQEDEVKRLAERLEEQIRGGGSFSAIAQQFSQSPTAAVGGDLGWISPNDISPALKAALDQMKPGDLSPPIRVGGGYYVLVLADRRLPGQGSSEDVELSIVEAGAALPPQAPPEYRAKLNAALQQVTAAGSDCSAFAAAAHKIGLPFVRNADKIKAGVLPPPIRRLALALTAGQVSKPFPVEGGVGIVMLCDRKDAPAPKLPTADQVRDNLGREHLDVLARRYLRDLRRGAYVDIRG